MYKYIHKCVQTNVGVAVFDAVECVAVFIAGCVAGCNAG